MVFELLKIGTKMRRGLIFTIRGCFRSICNHPFLVGMLCFLIYMYRSSPFMFSLLVSASPVLICTAILLGTLLSFGQPNIPEIEIEEKTTYEAVPIKTGLSRDAIIVEQNDSHYVERYSEKRRDEREQSDEEPSLSASKLGGICGKGSSDDSAPLMEESPREGKLENGEICEANRELDDVIHEQKTEWNEERLSDGEVMKNHYSPVPKVDDEHMESDDEKSVADSFDSERVNVDCLDSPPHSPWKQIEDQEDLEEEEDDAIDSGSDGAESSSPDASMADIMPMLDELHPLLDEEAAQPVQISRDNSDAESEQSMESSTSSSSESVDEIENHDDLEVAEDENDDDEDAQGDKEEQTKSAITWTEEDQKNLMDLGSSEIERNQRLENLILRRRTRKYTSMVPEINLIDLESSDFPFHVAPISTTRQNPFDLPQDSCDNSGLPPIPGSAPSILLPRRNPFDIPYDYTSEEKPGLMGDRSQEELTTSQSREPFFRRHESFSVGPSVFAPPNRQEKQDIKMRPYFVPERMVSEESSYPPFQRQSSEMSDSKVSSVPETESVGSVEDLEYQKLAEEDNPQEIEVISRMEEVIEECPSGDHELVPSSELSEEDVPPEPELISEMEHVSEHIGHGSQSSGEEEEESLDVDSCSEVVEQRYSRGSSSSSLSEVSDRRDGEGLSMLNGRRDGIAEEPDISTKTAIESTDLSITNALVDDVPHKEPVYDSSPPAVRKDVSSSSSSDVHAESDLRSPPVLVKRTVSFIERESENQEIEKDNPSNIEMLSEPSTLHPADENESARVDIGVREHDNINSDSSGVGASVEENVMDKHTQGQVPSSTSDFDIHTVADDNNLGKSEEEKCLLISGREGLVRVPPLEGQLKEDHSIDKQETVLSPNSDADYQEANEKLMFTPSAGGSTSHFYDIRMHDPDYEHLDEVQVPNTPVESFENVRTIQNLNIPEVYELHHDISPNINSPYSPDFISMPSSISEEANSHVDMETILEEDDEIKEIDGLLSELDSVGDFSITSGSNEFEKHIDTVGESLSSAHHAETSTTEIVNSAEHAMHLGNSSDVIDIHEEDMEYFSELQTFQTSIADHIDTSNREFNGRDGQNSTDQITSEGETNSKENEAKPANSVLNHSYEDTISRIPELEMHLTEDVGSFPEAELVSIETKVMVESAEVFDHDQVDINTASEMPKFEDIHVVKQSSEIEKPVVLDPPEAELVIGETIAEHSEHKTLHVNTSVVDPTHETPILEVRSIEEAALDNNEVNNGSTVNHGVPDSVDGIIHVVDNGETQGTSELHVEETIPSEGTSLPANKLLDGNSEKELKPNMDDGSAEVKEEKLDSSMGEESSVKEGSGIATEKPDHEVKEPQGIHSAESVKEKGKISKRSSSSSSSSSSSESNSSDSD